MSSAFGNVILLQKPSGARISLARTMDAVPMSPVEDSNATVLATSVGNIAKVRNKVQISIRKIH